MSGSAVRSYKERLDVFIADREREAGAPLEGWWRQITEPGPGSRPFQPAVKQHAFPPPRPLLLPLLLHPTWEFCLVWLGLAWFDLGWAGWWSRGMTLRYPTMKCAHAYMKTCQHRHQHIIHHIYPNGDCFHGVPLVNVTMKQRDFPVNCHTGFGPVLHISAHQPHLYVVYIAVDPFPKNHILSLLDFLPSGSLWFQLILVYYEIISHCLETPANPSKWTFVVLFAAS